MSPRQSSQESIPPATLPLNARRILCVYENQSLSPDSISAVPRVTSQLLQRLAARHPQTEFLAAGPAGGNIAGVRNLAVIPSQAMQLRNRIRQNRIFRRFSLANGIKSTAQYQRSKAALKTCVSIADERTIVLSMTHVTAVLAKQILPQSRSVYWIHSMPRMGTETDMLAAVNSSDAIATPSRALYMDLFQLLCRDRFNPPTWVIPNCIDHEQFKPLSESEKDATRSQLGLKPGEVAIVHVGRGPEKGLQVVQAALPLCRYRDNDLVLVSVGGATSDRRRVCGHAEVLETGRVTPDQLNRIYQACDFAVVPSVWWENCPLALIEMLSLGLCVIASRVGGIPEMIQHNQNGMLVDAPNEVTAWAAAIDHAAASTDQRRHLGCAARQSVKGRFGQEQFLHRWEMLLNSLLAND